MCGRYSFDVNIEELEKYYGLTESQLDFTPKEEICPTNTAPVLIADGKLRLVEWGFKPSFQKGVLINARGETVHEKKTFQEAFQRRRCVVFSSGFYEWKKEEGASTKFLITSDDEPFLAMAGLWEVFGDTANFVIVTTASADEMEGIHPRMPVLLHKDEIRNYLNHEQMNQAWWNALLLQEGKHLTLRAVEK